MTKIQGKGNVGKPSQYIYILGIIGYKYGENNASIHIKAMQVRIICLLK